MELDVNEGVDEVEADVRVEVDEADVLDLRLEVDEVEVDEVEVDEVEVDEVEVDDVQVDVRLKVDVEVDDVVVEALPKGSLI